MTPGVLSGLSTLRRYILITRSLASRPCAAVTVELRTDAEGSHLHAQCVACPRVWDRLTCGASWATVMAVIGHACGDALGHACPECGQIFAAAPGAPPALVRTTDGWICTVCGQGRAVAAPASAEVTP